MIPRAAIAIGEKGMVRPGWLEHPTYCFVGSRSIHLSYGRVQRFYWQCIGFPGSRQRCEAARKSPWHPAKRDRAYCFEYNPGCNGPA